MAKYYLKDLLNELFPEGYEIVSQMYGGMMNRSYILEDHNHKKYVVYVANKQAGKLVHRDIEEQVSTILSDLNITSKMIYFDKARGIKIKEYIEGESLNKIDYYDYDKVAGLLHRIHDSKELANINYHPFSRLSKYENNALDYRQETNKYRYLKDFFASHIHMLDVKEKVLCHNDFQRSNILRDFDDNYWIIDFEFAANNDRIYDIATFANDNIEDGERLLMAYFKKPTIEHYRRFYLWRIFISLQWADVAIAKHYQNEGKHTKHNFLQVAEYFVNNGIAAKEKFEALKDNYL